MILRIILYFVHSLIGTIFSYQLKLQFFLIQFICMKLIQYYNNNMVVQIQKRIYSCKWSLSIHQQVFLSKLHRSSTHKHGILIGKGWVGSDLNQFKVFSQFIILHINLNYYKNLNIILVSNMLNNILQLKNYKVIFNLFFYIFQYYYLYMLYIIK